MTLQNSEILAFFLNNLSKFALTLFLIALFNYAVHDATDEELHTTLFIVDSASTENQ